MSNIVYNYMLYCRVVCNVSSTKLLLSVADRNGVEKTSNLMTDSAMKHRTSAI